MVINNLTFVNVDVHIKPKGPRIQTQNPLILILQ